jgi:hypothetical protein
MPPRFSLTTPTGAGVPITSSHHYATGDWFAIPLRFGLFAVGRAAAVDGRGIILGYFFGRFFERLPVSGDILALTPGDAEIIGVCDQHGLRSGEWPVIATARTRDPRPWVIPIFRTIEPAVGVMRWKTFDPADLTTEIHFEHEPVEAGLRNWGLPMTALAQAPMSWAAVEFELWRCFRVFQNGMHRKYIADMQRGLAAEALVPPE